MKRLDFPHAYIIHIPFKTTISMGKDFFQKKSHQMVASYRTVYIAEKL